MVGHPFDLLLRQERYDTIKAQLATRGSAAGLHAGAGSPSEARAAITESLNAAHFLYEGSLIAALEPGENERRAHHAELSTQLESKEARIQALSAELAQIRSSRGWRLLSAYASAKHRFFLPVYRLLGRAAQDDRRD